MRMTTAVVALLLAMSWPATAQEWDQYTNMPDGFNTTLSGCRNRPVRRPFVLRVIDFARLSKTLSNSATPGPSPIVNLTKQC